MNRDAGEKVKPKKILYTLNRLDSLKQNRTEKTT